MTKAARRRTGLSGHGKVFRFVVEGFESLLQCGGLLLVKQRFTALAADPGRHAVQRELIPFAHGLKAGEIALQLALAMVAFHNRFLVFRSLSHSSGLDT